MMMLHQSKKRGTRFILDPLKDKSPATTEEPPLPLQDDQIKPSKKQKATIQKPAGKILSGPPKQLHLPQIVHRGDHTGQPVIRDESPWDTYKKEFDCDLAGDVAVVVHCTCPLKALALRTFPGEVADKMLRRFGQLQHENIMSVNEWFRVEDAMYALSDDLPLTLEHLVACDKYLSEIQLASILTQVLEGLSYLVAEGFEHRSLKSSSILLGFDGAIKIGMFTGMLLITLLTLIPSRVFGGHLHASSGSGQNLRSVGKNYHGAYGETYKG
jgi:serine/threonine protein kinase